MQLFDLHCDTLYRIITKNLSTNSEKLSITPIKASFLKNYKQLMAVWIPDEIRGEKAFELYSECVKIYKKRYSVLNNPQREFMLAVENGSIIGGDLSKISILKAHGVKTVTIVYNSDNELGSGNQSDSLFGLTPTGKKSIPVFEESGIVIDLSHSSERTFFDVAELATKPFIATHSNSFTICPHKRNLTDAQFKEIVRCNGLVGINFYPPFLNPNPDDASLNDIIKHIYHFLSLGGEDVLCIGSDFDGCDALKTLNTIDKLPKLYEALIKHGFTEQVVQKIFFINAHNFFT